MAVAVTVAVADDVVGVGVAVGGGVDDGADADVDADVVDGVLYPSACQYDCWSCTSGSAFAPCVCGNG